MARSLLVASLLALANLLAEFEFGDNGPTSNIDPQILFLCKELDVSIGVLPDTCITVDEYMDIVVKLLQ